MDAWLFGYEGFDSGEEGLREALCTVGNGYFATRGALPEVDADDVHYPGTYGAGLFNRLSSEISGRIVENESMVNLPNWLPLRFRLIEDGQPRPWITPGTTDLTEHRVGLDLRRGVFERRSRFRLDDARTLLVEQQRFVSMDEMHLAALETTLTVEGGDATLEIESALDGSVTNSGVARYRELPSQHLAIESTEGDGDGRLGLVVHTTQSRVRIALAARTELRGGDVADPATTVVEEREGRIAERRIVTIRDGAAVTVEKIVSLFTGRDVAITEPFTDARGQLDEAPEFAALLQVHESAWRHLWNHVDLDIGSDPESDTLRILRLHLFHAFVTVSPHTMLVDAGVPARGLHGEAYRGHIFWDELFVFPLFSMRMPELTRALLLYRFRRLDRARHDASLEGHRGAMYPWQSGSNGREETQTMHLNPKSGRWLPDASHLQRHVGAAIAYNAWHYHQATNDMEFLRSVGAEMIVEIARFWASIASFDEATERWSIRGVMGPDEYHEAYPDRDEPGLDDNAYTNVMAVWCLCRALDVLECLPPVVAAELRERLHVDDDELKRWQTISTGMRICFHEAPDGSGPVISQFDGYDDLEEFDWDGYRQRYGDIARLDRILEAEGDTPNRYKVSKQADVLMLFYLLSAEELGELFERLGYEWDGALIPRTIEYYRVRTSHGSTLSRVVESWLEARSDREHSWELFCQALRSDVDDVQGGTTPEGIHLGAMAGTVDLIQRCYTGIELRADALHLNPAIPAELGQLGLVIRYRGQTVRLGIFDHTIEIAVEPGPGGPVDIAVRGDHHSVDPGSSITVST